MKVAIILVSMGKGNVLKRVAESPATIGINASPNITTVRLIKAVFAGILFSEIRMPTQTPVNIRLIVETHRTRRSYSFPIKFNSLRKYSNITTMKAIETTHATFFVCIISSKTTMMKKYIKTSEFH
jgi:hypothetical protein